MADDEFNSIVRDNNKETANSQETDNSAIAEKGFIPTNPKMLEMINPRKTAKLGRAAGLINAGLSGTAVISSFLVLFSTKPQPDSTVVIFENLESTDQTITCSLRLDNRGSQSYFFELTNDFTIRKTPIQENTFVHTEENLKPGLYYTVAVRSGEMIISTQRIATLIEAENQKS